MKFENTLFLITKLRFLPIFANFADFQNISRFEYTSKMLHLLDSCYLCKDLSPCKKSILIIGDYKVSLENLNLVSLKWLRGLS